MSIRQPLTFALLLLCFLFPIAFSLATDDPLDHLEGPFIIHELSIDPQDPETIYAITSNYGVLKTRDGGKQWAFANRGLRSYTHHGLLLDPMEPKTVYVGGWGSGVFKSINGGADWVEHNTDLDNTAIHAMAIDPELPQQLFTATTLGIYRTTNGALTWRSFTGSLPIHELGTIRCLVASPISQQLYLCTEKGLYLTDRTRPDWKSVGHPIKGLSISVVAVEPGEQLVFAATMKGGLFKSTDHGQTWTSLRQPLKGNWIRKIVFSPTDEKILYLATSGHGVLKSTDGGATWQASNQGLTDPEVRSLVIHPKNPAILYAGTQEQGIFRSDDGGTTWRSLPNVPVVTVREVVASLDRSPSVKPDPYLEVPAAFSKCNQCHGWGDPGLNQKTTYWRMPLNRRVWAETVKRMGPLAGLTPKEETRITKFLTRYTHEKATGTAAVQVVQRACGRCHALKINETCMAGDCQKQRLVQTGPRPWDLVVGWMQRMGAKLSFTEMKTVLDYLYAAFPPEPYPLTWLKLPAKLGEGGWNIVLLQSQDGFLYAGVEGNGLLFRSEDGIRWQVITQTDQYSVYALTSFRGALYVGTHNPMPQVWRSRDGSHWDIAATLPEQEKGIFSFGVFKDKLYAGTGRGRIYRSKNGIRWKQVGDLKQVSEASFPHWVRFLIPFRGHLYAGMEKGPLYRTKNGHHWEAIPQPVTGQLGARGAAVFKSAFYVGTTGGGTIWRTRDGASLEEVFTTPSHVQRGYVAAMTVVADTLYASVDGYVFGSQDGQVWKEVGNLGPHTIEALAMFKNDLYAGTLIPPNANIYRASVLK